MSKSPQSEAYDALESTSRRSLTSSTKAHSTSESSEKPSSSTHNIGGDIYQQDGDYIKDIEVNDLRNRYTLTKGPTQKMVNYSYAC